MIILCMTVLLFFASGWRIRAFSISKTDFTRKAILVSDIQTSGIELLDQIVRTLIVFFFCKTIPHRQCGGCKIFLCHFSSFLSCPLLRLSDLFRARTPPYRRPVQLAVPIGDDGQLMSGASSGWPVLWLSTHAVQLTVPIGDDGQLMSGASSGWVAVPDCPLGGRRGFNQTTKRPIPKI